MKKYSSFENNVLDYFDLRLKEKIKGKVVVKYSAYNTDSKGVPINNLDQVVFKGSIKFYHEWDSKLFEAMRIKGSRTYVSDTVTDPTYLDVCKLANDMLKETGNKHHVFLEEIVIDRGMFSSKGHFIMGS